MISYISPAKSMNFEDNSPISKASKHIFQEETRQILEVCQNFTIQEIMHLMGVSEKIALLNFDRFQNFTQMLEKQAIFSYDGDVYNNIEAQKFNEQELNIAQKHVRIISGFYGLLKPLDMIKPYRLEMVTDIKAIAPRGLANFWSAKVTKSLNEELKTHTNKVLINLASNEYSAAIDYKSIEAKFINIHFRERRNNQIKTVALNAKRARGMMINFIIKNYIDNPESLKNFDYAGYQFIDSISDQNNYYFIK